MRTYKLSSFFLLSAACALFTGCSVSFWSGSRTVQGSGHVVSENREVAGFDRVSLSGAGDLSIAQGDQEGLTIEADDNLLPLIKSEVSGGRLRIGPENVNLRSTKPIHYELRLKNLKGLQLSGSLEAQAASLQTEQLDISISGSGKVRLPKLETGGLDVSVSGSGDLEVAGKADRQNIAISGSGDYRAGDFDSQKATIAISGSGDATLWAREALEAVVSGSGGIKYYGTPQLDTHVSGSGSVHSLGGK
jgi:Putative auto-transporter adhesin, head GIN domain